MRRWSRVQENACWTARPLKMKAIHFSQTSWKDNPKPRCLIATDRRPQQRHFKVQAACCCTHCKNPVLHSIDCPCPVGHIACFLFCVSSIVPALLDTLHVSCFASHRLSLSCWTHCMFTVLRLIDCPCPVEHIACFLFCIPSTVPVLLDTLHVSCFAFHRLYLSCCTHCMFPVFLPIDCPSHSYGSSLFVCLCSRCVIFCYVPFISRNISASARGPQFRAVSRTSKHWS